MRQITVNLYQFDELSDAAKEKAREWWRECENSDFDAECVYDDAVRMGALLGIEIDERRVPLMNGETRPAPVIYYSGFSSQGDGACFEGSYRYAKGAPAAIIAETSAGRDDASKGDRELLRIARELQKIQSANFYQLRARMNHSGHYYHSGCMSVDVERYDEKEMTRDAEDEVTQLMRDFADWIYSQLESEYDYRMSDEQVDDAIRINEYDFDEDGSRA